MFGEPFRFGSQLVLGSAWQAASGLCDGITNDVGSAALHSATWPAAQAADAVRSRGRRDRTRSKPTDHLDAQLTAGRKAQHLKGCASGSAHCTDGQRVACAADMPSRLRGAGWLEITLAANGGLLLSGTNAAVPSRMPTPQHSMNSQLRAPCTSPSNAGLAARMHAPSSPGTGARAGSAAGSGTVCGAGTAWDPCSAAPGGAAPLGTAGIPSPGPSFVSASRWCSGTAFTMRARTRTAVLPGSATPAPGAYNTQLSLMGNGPAFTLGPKWTVRGCGQATPGPADYQRPTQLSRCA